MLLEGLGGTLAEESRAACTAGYTTLKWGSRRVRMQIICLGQAGALAPH
jgi:hypothetical protein